MDDTIIHSTPQTILPPKNDEVRQLPQSITP
jgi:hypothetical protein